MISITIEENPISSITSGDAINVSIGETASGAAGPAGPQGPSFTASGLVGTPPDYTSWDSTGHQIMNGDARPWRDELGDALSLRSSGPGVAANINDVTVDFAANADLNDFLYKNLQTNHDRDETARVYPHLHFLQNQNVIPNMLLQYRWQAIGEQQDATWKNLRMNIPTFTYVSGVIHQVIHTISGIAPPANSDISDIIQFKIFRDNANASGAFTGADTYTGVAQVMSFDVHLQLNSVGSTEQYAK